MSTVETDLNDPREFLLFSHWRSPTVYGSRESRHEQFWDWCIEEAEW